MTLQSQYQTLFAYHWHNTNKLVELAGKLDDAAYRNAAPGARSAHELIFHLYQTLQSWRGGLETGTQPPHLDAVAYPDLASLQRGLMDEQKRWQDLLAGLDDAAIAETINMTSRRGDTSLFPRWRVLHHLLFHGMQHHTELARLLTDAGHSPGDLDFAFYRG